MAKRGKRQPHAPQTEWDMGASGPANRVGIVVERVEEPNPNGVRRARRIDMAEVYYRRGVLTRRQYLAAMMLRTAYEQTGKSPPAIKAVQVDSSPKPDQHIAILLDRMAIFATVFKHVPAADRAILDRLCIQGTGPGKPYVGTRYRAGLALMASACERLADRMKI